MSGRKSLVVGTAMGFFAVAVSACGGVGETGGDEAAPIPKSEAEVSAGSSSTAPGMATTTTTVAVTTSVEADTGEEAPLVGLPVGRLVFDSDRAGSIDLYMLEEGSPDPVQLTDDLGSDRVGHLTFDGEAVLFQTDRAGAPDSPTGLRRYDLYRLDLATGEEEHLLGSRTYNSGAVLSPDGSTLAFASDANGEHHIYLAEPDASSPRQVTQENRSNGGAAWSPDGTEIAYSTRAEDDWDIWVMNADGSDRRPLVEGPDNSSSPTWSPDGTRIAFRSDRDGTMDIHVLDIGSGDITQLTSGSADDQYPSWSPDGAYIAFDGDRNGSEPDIYMVAVEDGTVSRLADDPARDAFPDWGS